MVGSFRKVSTLSFFSCVSLGHFFSLSKESIPSFFFLVSMHIFIYINIWYMYITKYLGYINKRDIQLSLRSFSKIIAHIIPILQIGYLSASLYSPKIIAYFFSFIFISWRLITSQYCSGFCHTLTWISHGVTCIPHPDPPSHLPLHPIPLGLPSAPGPSTWVMHPTWAGGRDCLVKPQRAELELLREGILKV